MRQLLALSTRTPAAIMASRSRIFQDASRPEKILDDARVMAQEALALHLEGLAEDGEAVPEPSTLEQFMADHDNRAGVAILVAVPQTRAESRPNGYSLFQRMFSETNRSPCRTGGHDPIRFSCAGGQTSHPPMLDPIGTARKASATQCSRRTPPAIRRPASAAGAPFRFPLRLVYSSAPLREPLVTRFHHPSRRRVLARPCASSAAAGGGRSSRRPGAPATRRAVASVSERRPAEKHGDRAGRRLRRRPPPRASASSAASAPPAPAKVPHKSFLLDPLL